MAAKEQIFYATGRRKTSSARVYLKPGKGLVSINGKKSDDYLILARKVGGSWLKTTIDTLHKAREIAAVYANNKVNVVYYDLQDKFLMNLLPT